MHNFSGWFGRCLLLGRFQFLRHSSLGAICTWFKIRKPSTSKWSTSIPFDSPPSRFATRTFSGTYTSFDQSCITWRDCGPRVLSARHGAGCPLASLWYSTEYNHVEHVPYNNNNHCYKADASARCHLCFVALWRSHLLLCLVTPIAVSACFVYFAATLVQQLAQSHPRHPD